MTQPWLDDYQFLGLRARDDGEASGILIRAARIDEWEWRYLRDLMEAAGCTMELSELRMAHPEFDGCSPSE